MGILLGVYKDLAKEAEAQEQYADIQEKVEILSKYAEAATELLNAEFPENYDKADVVELADKLIQRDLEIAEVQEKTAEAVETLAEYVKVARALLDEEGNEYYDSTVEKLASSLFELDAEDQFYKEAAIIAEAGFVDEFNKLAETDFTTIAEIDEAMKMAGIGSSVLGEIGGALKGAGKWAVGQGKNAVGMGEVGALRQAAMGGAANKMQAKGIGVMAGAAAGVGGLGYAATRGGNN